MRKRVLIAVLVLEIAVGLGLLVAGTSNGPVTDRLAVSVYFTYPGTTRPEDDDPEQEAIIPLIDNLARGDKLEIAMYWLSDEQLKGAISSAHSRGVDIRIYLEEENACKAGADAADYLAAGIPVRVDNRSGLMHNKFAVLDYTDPKKTDIIITGSYNWTEAANEDNWENLVVIESATVAADYETNFEEMWTNWSKPFQGCR